MKKIRIGVVALMVGASAMLMSSCIGKFALFNSLVSWNRKVTNVKLLNWVIFLILSPVHSLAFLADMWIINSIEFWTGKSPVAGIDMKVQSEKGEYHVKSIENGYRIERLGSGEVANFVFDSASKTWSVESNGQSVKLVQFIDDNNAKAFFGEQELVFDVTSTQKLLAQQ